MAFSALARRPSLRSVVAALVLALREHGLQIILTLAVFILFIAVASGNLEILFAADRGSSNLGAIIVTPQFALLIVIGCVMALLLPVLNPIAGSLLTFACTLPVYWMGCATTKRPLLPMEFSLLTILVMYVVHVLVSYFKEVHRKQKVISLLGQYIPPSLAHALSRNRHAIELGGDARELTIMFCDVRDFTTHAEDMDPKELSALLNAMFTPLTEVVHRHGGTIDKFIGDAVNLAARLESLTRVFDVPIIVGEGTRAAFPAAGYRELGLVKIKGKQQLARVFEPSASNLDPDSTVIAKMQRHNAALAHYYQRQWIEAQQEFRKLALTNPNDRLYSYYLKRIDAFKKTPPADDWRGELRFTVS